MIKRGTYTSDQQWANTFRGTIEAIVQQHINVFTSLSFASRNDDINGIADFVVTVSFGQFLSRIRATQRYRDLTLRAWRSSGAKTEVAKILDGNGKWYFYGWTPNDLHLDEWMIIDLDRMRSAKIIQAYQCKVQYNTDKTTGFISIPRAHLEHIGAIRIQLKHDRVIRDDGARWCQDRWITDA